MSLLGKPTILRKPSYCNLWTSEKSMNRLEFRSQVGPWKFNTICTHLRLWRSEKTYPILSCFNLKMPKFPLPYQEVSLKTRLPRTTGWTGHNGCSAFRLAGRITQQRNLRHTHWINLGRGQMQVETGWIRWNIYTIDINALIHQDTAEYNCYEWHLPLPSRLIRRWLGSNLLWNGELGLRTNSHSHTWIISSLYCINSYQFISIISSYTGNFCLGVDASSTCMPPKCVFRTCTPNITSSPKTLPKVKPPMKWRFLTLQRRYLDMFLGWWEDPFKPMVRLGNVWGFWSSHLRLNAKCLGTGMDDECTNYFTELFWPNLPAVFAHQDSRDLPHCWNAGL